MIRVKICGLTRPEDAVWANRLRPDYVGFVFAPGRRRVTPRRAAAIAALLDPGIAAVGVFADAPESEILAALGECPLRILQLHGGETPEFCGRMPVPVWKALRVRGPLSRAAFPDYPAEALVLDASRPGGGQTFPWEWTEGFTAGGLPIVLAGGLHGGNVTAAVARVHPFAVDVSSGVETGGVKDPEKIRDFIMKARHADERA